MKVFIATSETQGQRDDDFCWTVEGELVMFPPIECDDSDDCGCRRSMAGLVSHRTTTTIAVTEREDLNPRIYSDLIKDGLKGQGYLGDDLRTDPEVEDWLQDFLGDLITMPDVFSAGTVLERRDNFLWVRRRGDEGSG